MSIGNEAQSALNVESSLNGTALLKRYGYARTASLTISTSPATGAYAFTDTNGDKVDIVCQDHNCAESKNNSSFYVFLSTAGGACIPTRWQFTQINGLLYGVNDCFDLPWSYDGTTRVSLSTNTPSGSVIEATKDRLVISGVSASPGSVYYSQSGNPSNFIVGINSADPYVDPIGSQGDRVRALKYSLGRLFIFKTNSITSCILGDQYTSKCFPVSNTVGTSDPLSIVEIPGSVPAGQIVATSGALLFRGSDLNYWQLDQEGLHVISRKISNLTASQTAGSIQSNTQITQAGWNAGNQTPSGSWNTTTIAGSLFPSSFTFIDNSSATFNLGTFPVSTTTLGYQGYTVGLSTVDTYDLRFSTGQWPIPNGNFSNGTINGWTCSHANCTGGYYSITCAPTPCASPSGTCLDLNTDYIAGGNITVRSGNVYIYDGAIAVDTITVGNFNNPNGVINLASLGLSTRTLSIEFSQFEQDNQAANCTNNVQSTTFSAISTLYWGSSGNLNGQGYNLTLTSVTTDAYFGTNQSSATAFYASQIYNDQFQTALGGPFGVSFSSNPGSGISFEVRSSSSPNNDLWGSWVSISSQAQITTTGQYQQYGSSFTTSIASTTPVLYYSMLPFAATGQFVTECIQPGPGISAWGILSCAQTLSGNGSEVFYATSAATCASLPTGTPSTWQTSVSNNATLSISTNAAIYLGWESLLTSATDQAQINACTIYWSNGIPAAPSWGIYDPVKNAAYWTLSVNNSATANRVLKYDMNLNEWFPFGLNATALFRDQNQNAIFFGDSAAGYWNKYGGVTSDNGAAINAYWISRDFGNQISPFLDNTYNRISLVTKNQVTGNMTVGYTFSNGQSGSYNVSLSTTPGIVYVHSNQNLLKASPFQFMNINLGNDSENGFEVDAMQLDYTSFPWRPQNP